MFQTVMDAVALAGAKIMDIYNTEDFGVEMKSDDSPLTKADQAAHDLLVEELNALAVGPVLSEEDADIPWQVRKLWDQYWLVDPLDGTKEFIKRNDEFTVNVALIRHGIPVLGVVYAPAKSLWYFGNNDPRFGKVGAFKKEDNGSTQSISPSALPSKNQRWRVVGSRSHTSEDFDAFMSRFENANLVSMGSSLKLCMVAEGSADLYPRLIPTCEWDTAAAQAVVEAAGAQVLNWETKEPLRYNTKEQLLNPYFVVCAEKSDIWLDN